MDDDVSVRVAQARKTSPFICAKMAANYLDVSLRYLEQLRARGEGPRYRRHCRRISYHIDDLDQWSVSTGAPGKAA